MSIITAPSGTRDILPSESWKWTYIITKANEVMHNFGFNEIKLPMFEHTELFARGVGDTTDIVEKEMYTFNDNGGRSVTLRPEATAGTMRAVLENNICAQNATAKLWSYGPMFRCEKPQKGRYRQFYQIDAECLGISSPVADAEIIALNVELLRALGLPDLEVVINTVGCEKCRPAYRQNLIEYFTANKDKLCDTCLARLERNPLRIFDCKNEKCRLIAGHASNILYFLCKDCRDHFHGVMEGLQNLGIEYTVAKNLVRGLDYYTKTAFEIRSNNLGAQNAVSGGGRYDNLSSVIGGNKIPSVGFACGIDRIILVMEELGISFGDKPRIKVYIAALGEDTRKEAQKLAFELRRIGISAEYDLIGRSFKAQLKNIGEYGYLCLLGSEEMANGVVAVKDLETREQINVPRDNIIRYLLEAY